MENRKTYILVEGVTDVIFLKGLLISDLFLFKVDETKVSTKKEVYLYNDSRNHSVILQCVSKIDSPTGGGWTAFLQKRTHEDIIEKIEQGYTCLLFIDSDDETKDGGFYKRKEKVTGNFPKHIIEKGLCNMFFFPNNKDDGDLEDILKEIVQPNIGFECLERFAECYSSYKKIDKKRFIIICILIYIRPSL